MLCQAGHARGWEITSQGGSRDPTTCLASAPAAWSTVFQPLVFSWIFLRRGGFSGSLSACATPPSMFLPSLPQIPAAWTLACSFVGFVLSRPSRTCPQTLGTVRVLLPAESRCPQVTAHRGTDWGAGLVAGCEGLHQDHPGEGAAQPMGYLFKKKKKNYDFWLSFCLSCLISSLHIGVFSPYMGLAPS